MAELSAVTHNETDRTTYESLFDRETAAPLWPLLIDRLTIALARARRRNRAIAVIAIEKPRTYRHTPVSNPKFVVDLQTALRADDTVARLSQHTFVVVCNEIATDADTAAIARRLLQTTGIVAHLGIALSHGSDTPQGLLDRAVRSALHA